MQTGERWRTERTWAAGRIRQLLPDARLPDAQLDAARLDAARLPDSQLDDFQLDEAGAETDLDTLLGPAAADSQPAPGDTAPGEMAPGEMAPDNTAPRRPRAEVRWLPSRRAAVGTAVGVLIVAALTGWWLFTSTPRPIAVASGAGYGTSAVTTPNAAQSGVQATPQTTDAAGPAPAPTAATSPGASGAAPNAAPAPELIIDVAGKVVTPGIYRLPPGARVYQAVQAAGGALPGVDTSGLNLAAPLVDGEQVIVGGNPGTPGTVLPPVAVPGAGAGAGTPAAAAPVSLNSASRAQLESLPGVGPVLAQKIIDWRTEHGRFRSIDELRQVSGIGEAKFAVLKSKVVL